MFGKFGEFSMIHQTRTRPVTRGGSRGSGEPPILTSFLLKPAICINKMYKNSNLRKEVGIAIKSKETSSQFESVRNSYVAI